LGGKILNLDSIAGELKKELDRLSRAIAALVGGTSARGTKRKAGSKRAGRKRRPMSAAARKKLSMAMKKRWAARRKG